MTLNFIDKKLQKYNCKSIKSVRLSAIPEVGAIVGTISVKRASVAPTFLVPKKLASIPAAAAVYSFVQSDLQEKKLEI